MKGRIFKMFYTLTMGKSFYTFFFPSLPDTFSVPKPRLSHVRVLLPLSISQLSHSQGHNPLISTHLAQPISHRCPPTDRPQPPSSALQTSSCFFCTNLSFSSLLHCLGSDDGLKILVATPPSCLGWG